MTKKRKLMKPLDPDKFIHENLRELGLNVELAAAAVGVRATTLIDLLTEEELSPETAFDLMIDIHRRRELAGEFDVKKFTPPTGRDDMV
jgi:plasmid maintenance system antidote protein VapI